MAKLELSIVVEPDESLTKKQVADELAEQELDTFDKWVTGTFSGTHPMASFERAMVKTYIMYKLEKRIRNMPD